LLSTYEAEFIRLLERQIRTAAGQRLEMLKKDKTGEKRLYCAVIRPVFPSAADEIVMEYEIPSMTGVRIYLDFYLPSLRWALECEGYVSHAEKITRDRFDFEKSRIRAMDHAHSVQLGRNHQQTRSLPASPVRAAWPPNRGPRRRLRGTDPL